MELKGKKINFLGDSITEGVGASEEQFMYPNVIAAECGLAAARNYGISGTRIARQDDEENFGIRSATDILQWTMMWTWL